jgi:uncharacterized protein
VIRIGLISDTHIPEARQELWPQVYEAFQNVDYILHAGDIHDLSVIDRLSAVATTFAARGNGDDGLGGRSRQPEDSRLRPAWLLELGGMQIGLVHDLPLPETTVGPTVRRAILRHFNRVHVDVVIHGDTHVESIHRIEGVLCVNPGSPTFPHNLTTRHGTIGFLQIQGGHADASIWQITNYGIEPFDWNSARPRSGDAEEATT